MLQSCVIMGDIMLELSSIHNYSVSNHNNIIAIYVTVLWYYRGCYVRAVVFVIIVLVIIVIL